MGHGYKDLEKKKSSDKLRDYRRSDKRAGLQTILSLEELRGILSMPCFYCTSTERIGADRIDSTKGHEIKNLVSCCARCNFFFGDIPYAAKIELREGMRIINQKGLMDSWTPPPERAKKPVEVEVLEPHPMIMITDEQWNENRTKEQEQEDWEKNY